MEATNLLMMMKRRDVARVEFPSDGPGVYSSREIQEKLNADRIQFEALSAIDARDPVALQQVGEAIDGVCEACHIANWYPHQVIPPLPLPAARGRTDRVRGRTDPPMLQAFRRPPTAARHAAKPCPSAIPCQIGSSEWNAARIRDLIGFASADSGSP